jgi:GTP pyrophosphokinase
MASDPLLTRRFVEAFGLAHELHAGDVRKGTTIPYFGHLLSVCGLVVGDGGDEDEAIAALLHDALEDHPERIDRSTLERRFGPRVRSIVEACTDTPSDYTGGKKPDWKQRKLAYLEHLRAAHPSDLRVSLSDKLDNARAILSDYREIGDALWCRFNASKADQLWYYRALVTTFRDVGVASRMLADLDRVVSEIEDLSRQAFPADTPSSVRIIKNGGVIDSVESWLALAPPKEAYQWKDRRSAKELAKAFCRSGEAAVPSELRSLLRSNPALGPVELLELWPEHKIALDSFRGETRNADLAGIGTAVAGAIAITVEAKADEPFADLIRAVLVSAPQGSNRPARIEALSRAIFGQSAEAVADLRYQLLHGVAASLILARERHAAAALFIVFEFQEPSPTVGNDRNAKDLQAFISALGPIDVPLKNGCLLGPFVVPGGETIPSDIPLFIGKAVRQLAPDVV